MLMFIVIICLVLIHNCNCQNINQTNGIILNSNNNCLGPPYIYVTIHEGDFVIKYSRDGCLLSDNILIDSPNKGKHNIHEYRSMLLGKYNGERVLYIADASNYDSKVNIYSNCNDSGQRNFIATAVSNRDNDGVYHTYGLALDKNNNLYISNQHTDNVLRFYANTFKHMIFPPAIRDDPDFRTNYYFKGTFKQFGEPEVHKNKEQGVRSIVIVNHELWIANMDYFGIVIVQLSTGISTNIILVEEPVSLYYNSINNLVYVSCKGKHRTGAVYAINPKTLRTLKEYRTIDMEHPTGVILYENTLYVAEQTLGCILSFDLSSTKYLGKIVKHIGEIEQIILSDC